MIDIHCHIIPGVDDGSQDMQTSMEMATLAAGDGIRTIVATPHVNSGDMTPADIAKRVSDLNERFRETGIPITVVPGGEVAAFLPPALVKNYSINGKGYILLEFPHTHMPLTAADQIRHLMMAGLRVVIAHPERNPSVIKNPGVLKQLIENTGAYTQITAGSISGLFGLGIRACARHLLKKDMVTIIASDAHSARGRIPVLSEGLKVASKILGDERASRLVHENPAAVVQGLPIPYPNTPQ